MTGRDSARESYRSNASMKLLNLDLQKSMYLRIPLTGITPPKENTGHWGDNDSGGFEKVFA